MYKIDEAHKFTICIFFHKASQSKQHVVHLFMAVYVAGSGGGGGQSLESHRQSFGTVQVMWGQTSGSNSQSKAWSVH